MIVLSTNWKDGSEVSKPIKRRRETKKVIKDVHRATDLEFRSEDVLLFWGISKINKAPTNGRKVIIDNKAGGGVVPYLPLPELKKKLNNKTSNQDQNNE